MSGPAEPSFSTELSTLSVDMPETAENPLPIQRAEPPTPRLAMGACGEAVHLRGAGRPGDARATLRRTESVDRLPLHDRARLGFGCPHCSFWADNFNGNIVHLAHRDVTLVAVSRAPYAKLAAHRQRMSGGFKWASSSGDGWPCRGGGRAFCLCHKCRVTSARRVDTRRRLKARRARAGSPGQATA